MHSTNLITYHNITINTINTMAITQQHFDDFMDELDTIKDVLRWTVTQFEYSELFYGHGTDNAWDEALVLLQYYLKIPVHQLNLVLDSRLTLSEKEEIYALLDKRINQRMPLPYITNEAWFAEMNFYVDGRALIPRSPIAELIKQDFQPWLELSNNHGTLNILEIGTGSACIPCAIAHHFSEQGIDVKIDATDISPEAMEVAKINISDYGFNEIINLIESDVFDNIEPTQQYDLILSNPPYVDAVEMSLLPQEYYHEPQSALSSGNDGLDCVKKILQRASAYLKDNGIIIIEVGASKPALEEQYPHVPFTWIDFENGGHGVFVLTKEQLVAAKIN